MKKLLVLFAFIVCGALAQAAAPNDVDTVWMRWMYDITDICWSPDDSTIAAFDGYDQKVNFIDPRNGNIKKQMPAPYAFYGAQYSKDGSFVLLNEGGGNYYPTTPYLIYTKTYEPRSDFENPGTPSRYYALSPDNKIAAASEDGTTIRIWDVETGKIIKTKVFGSHFDSTKWVAEWKREAVVNVSYTGDGKYLLITTDSVKKYFDKVYIDRPYYGHLYWVDTATLEIECVFRSGDGKLLDAKPSKTNKYIALNYLLYHNGNVNVQIYDSKSREFVYYINNINTNGICFTSDDKYVFAIDNSASPDERIQVWDIVNQKKVHTYPGSSYYSTIALNSNDSLLIASSGSNLILYRFNRLLDVEQENTIPTSITYPNPTHSQVNIEFSLTRAATTKVEILDMAGKSLNTVADEMMAEGSHTLTSDLAGLPTGTYFIRISSAGNTSTSKFVINK